MKLIKILERILKEYQSNADALRVCLSDILEEFEGKSYLKIPLSPGASLILIKDERNPLNGKRKFNGSPFPYVMNVEYFCKTLGSWNKELLEYGIKARSKMNEGSPSDDVGIRIHLIFHMSLNYRCNQYLKRQYRRLETYRRTHQISAYWRLGFELMRNSWSFKIACLNNWEPIWYKKFSLLELKKIFRGLFKILNLEELKTTISNVWIESPRGKWRQLGIPNKSWRIYLHMLNMFLSYIYEPKLNSEIYDGFIFNRGCKSWWESVLWGNYLNFSWILEADVSSGFPNLNLRSVKEALTQDSLIPENLIHLIMSPLTSELRASSLHPTLETYIEDKENKRWRNSSRSVHMGLGISPILFVITQHWVYSQIKLPSTDFKIKWYADDCSIYFQNSWILSFLKHSKQSWSSLIYQILSGENPLIKYINELPLIRESGLKFCTQKSHWVKTFGLWITPFTSLGLRLKSKQNLSEQILNYLMDDEPNELILQGYTRGRGFNPHTQKASTNPSHIKLEELSKRKNKKITLSLLKESYKSYFGLFLSKMYGCGNSSFSSFSWKSRVKWNSALGKILKTNLNKTLGPLEKWTEYNSGSKMNKLILGIIKGDSESKWVLQKAPNYIREIKPSWRPIKSDILLTDIPDPIASLKSEFYYENDYFRKYSELMLSPQQLDEYKKSYALQHPGLEKALKE